MAQVTTDTATTTVALNKRSTPSRATAKQGKPAEAGRDSPVREPSPEAGRAALDELVRISEELGLYEWERQHAAEWVKPFQSDPNESSLGIKR